jgi:hypothetical protein
METLTKILEQLGANFARVGWMYGAPVYPHPPWQPRPPKEHADDPASARVSLPVGHG